MRQTTARAINSGRPKSPVPRPLLDFDIEQVRIAAERVEAERIAAHPRFRALAARYVPSDPVAARRRLLAQSLRLTDTMAPSAYQQAREAQRVLGVRGDLELYQSGGRENAVIHLIEAPVVMEVQGRLLPLLDDGASLALFGHELGHYLAHGPWSALGPVHVVALRADGLPGVPPDLGAALQSLSVLRELTADRVGLLACQDLDAALRLEMVATTGLSADCLTWDTAAYLTQCQELMRSVIDDGGGIYASSHPEHSLRAYAAWLFSETLEFNALTGRGTGHRSLREVDEHLWELLGSSKLAAGTSYHMLDEPPRELQECALAACVIVAHADGEIGDEEVAVIETTFAPLVGDWRQYLELEVAHARFRESAPIIAAGGSDLAHSLFNLLVHVMGADGSMEREEVAAILFVGNALGCEGEYARRLDSTLRSLRVNLVLEQARATALPLPARNDEVEDAFEAFLAGVLRRGETVTTLRRLLRLLGGTSPTGELLTQIRAAFAARGIQTDADLGELGLDDRLHLEAPASRREPSSSPPAPELEPTRQNLIRALSRLRDQLVSGDGRSPSVRVRKVQAGRIFDLHSLERISAGRAERALQQLCAGEKVSLVESEESGLHPSARKAASELVALDREQRALVDETGTNDLYLGYPLVAGNVACERGGMYFVRGPLVLYPVALDRHGKGAPGYRVRPRADEPPIINQSLLRLVFNKTGLSYSEQVSNELDELVSADTNTDAILAKLAQYGLPITARASALGGLRELDAEALIRPPGLETEECALLGLFPQSSSDLLQDYDGLLKALSDPRQDVSSVLGAAGVLLPEALRSPLVAGRTEPSPEATIPVVAADPVQRTVIQECRRNIATVVDGPPGTGKSQVIVNLVADALRRGERVAVVCEKRAALDVVYQRLEVLGLRHAVGLVHDVHEDRKALYRQISARIDGFSAQPANDDETASVQRDHGEARARLDERAAALSRDVASGLTMGRLYSLTAGVPEPHLPAVPELADLPKDALDRLLAAATALHPLQPVWVRGSAFRDPNEQLTRQSFAASGSTELQALRRALDVAAAAARAYAEAAVACPIPVNAVAPARPALQRARDSRANRSDATGTEMFATLLDRAAAASPLHQHVEEALAVHARATSALSRYQTRVVFPESPELQHSVQVLKRWASSWLRFFVWAWWRARAEVRATLVTAWPERSAEPFRPDLVAEIHDRFLASQAWRVMCTCLTALGLERHLPQTATGFGPLLARVSTLARDAADLASMRVELAAAQAWPGSPRSAVAITTWDRAVDQRLRVLATQNELLSAGSAIRAAFPWVDELPQPEVLERLSAALERDGERLVEVDRLLDAARATFRGAERLFDELVAIGPDMGADRWRALLAAAWGSALLEHFESQHRVLRDLGTAPDDGEEARQAARFAELEQTLSELEVERILTRLDRAPLLLVPPAAKGKRRTEQQKIRDELLKETQKRSRVQPLRAFIRRFAAHGLLDLVPVWLVSPETMAILFPRKPLFDLIVFDEASQCTVESGLPVLARARRVVVAGDEKQMPPSSYFARSTGAEDDDPPAEEDTEARELQDMLAAESLLNLARCRVPHSGLAWHYRCRDEALIAFSNHALYHGELLTIPATATAAAPSVIHWVSLTNGAYSEGANPPEAEAVVDLVHDLLARDRVPSIGVVTFNIKQRRAILDAIDARCGSNAAFARVWGDANAGESLDQRPFVKNIENVQGDERDVVIFSLGHAPQERVRKGVATGEMYVPARFGPLGQRGGERRLNVAISRAKAECWVVASFKPSLLSVAQSKHAGPGLFKQFLEFAHHKSAGHHKPAEQVLDLVRETRLSAPLRDRPPPLEAYTPLVVQIHDALEKEGVPVQLNVGASRFRVPLALLDPADPTRFVLAILPEEGNPEEGASSAFDRHVHRPSVLRDRGWLVLRVTSASWRKRREDVLRQILELVPGARGALENEIWRRHRQALVVAPAAAQEGAARASVRHEREAEAALDSADVEVPATGDESPPWAQAIENVRFRRAIVHLHTHGLLNETELVNIVGGQRQARAFARQLDDWLEMLPFRVEVQQVGATKVYKNVGVR